MQIRDEHPGDSERISHIHYQAFKGHHTHAPGAEPVEHLIVERLRKADCLSLSLLAEKDGQAVAHIALSPAQVGACARGWHLLGPIGVLPECQRQGLGTALMQEAINRMRNMRSFGIVVVGDPAYYTRFGFASSPDLAYPGVPGQFVMGLPFTKEHPAGDITAHEAFSIC